MAGLYAGVGGLSDDISSPLLDKAVSETEASETVDGFRDNPETRPFEIESQAPTPGVGDDAEGCCPQYLKSTIATLLAAGGTAAMVLCFIYTPSIPVYIMGGVCLLNCIVMMLNEKQFLFNMPASRSAVVNLMETKKLLDGRMSSSTDEIEILERGVARCEVAERKLRGITEAQSSSVTEVVKLVRENEQTLGLIRKNIQQNILVDVIGTITRHHNNAEIFDSVKAKSLAHMIKMKVEEHSVIFDEEKFVNALALDATLIGAIKAVKKLLPLDGQQPEIDNDVYDMFALANSDKRQRGSIHVARAEMAGVKTTSLVPSSQRIKQHVTEDLDDISLLSDSEIPKKRENRLREQLRQFRHLAFPYFQETTEGKLLFGVLILLALGTSGIRVFFSYLMRDFYTALADKDIKTFYNTMYKFLISMVALIPVQVSYRYIRVKLGICWRNWLTGRVLKLYFSNKVYYGLERKSKASAGSARDYEDRQKEIDNPDQRIQQDVDSFTQYSLSFFLTVVTTIIDIVSFSFILFSILPELFIAIILFASIGTFFTVVIGKVLIKLNYEQLQREADFRFSLVRIRENAESIAFYGGEKGEKKEVGGKFTRVIDNANLINWATMKLDGFTTAYYYFVDFLPTFILAQKYFADLIEFGVIQQARQAFYHILDDFSIVVNEFTGIAAFMAGIDRLYIFMKTIQDLDAHRPSDDTTIISEEESSDTRMVTPPPTDGISVTVKDDVQFSLANTLRQTPQATLTIRKLRLTTPDNKRTLIDYLNLSLTKGQNLLIAGVSGAGKSSLLRAIAGLWTCGDGEIIRSSEAYFLPQRPYCPTGSLRDQLIYPSTAEIPTLNSRWSDDDLLAILTAVELPHLASRSGDGDPIRGLNAILDWSKTLSLGEQQRLAFGRLLVNRPRLVIMDESTSALDVKAENKMYNVILKNLKSYTGEPVTYISVGHRPTLLAYHDIKLLLDGGSSYASFISQEASARVDPESILEA